MNSGRIQGTFMISFAKGKTEISLNLPNSTGGLETLYPKRRKNVYRIIEL